MNVLHNPLAAQVGYGGHSQISPGENCLALAYLFCSVQPYKITSFHFPLYRFCNPEGFHIFSFIFSIIYAGCRKDLEAHKNNFGSALKGAS